jgi:hypothetical protein
MKAFFWSVVIVLHLLFASSSRTVAFSPSTLVRNTRLFDSVSAAPSYAAPASFSARSALSFKSAISNPEIMLIPNAATTSITIPLIKIRHPRSISTLYFFIISAKISALKLSGGNNFSASFSIFNPRQTSVPPQPDKMTSSQNQGDSINLINKLIYALLLSIHILILLISLTAITYCRRPK